MSAHRAAKFSTIFKFEVMKGLDEREHMMHCNKHALSKEQSSFLVPVDVPLFDSGLFQAPLFAVSAFHGITAVYGILVDLVVL